MKKDLLAVTVVAVLFATSALAADAPKTPPTQTMTPPGMMEKSNNPEDEAMRFKHRREERLLMLSNRITEMQKQKDCVQASNDMDSFRKCGGDRGDRMRMMMEHKRDGGKGKQKAPSPHGDD